MNRPIYLTIFTIGFSFFLIACDTGGPVVGAPCSEDWPPCPNGCYDLDLDENHCGACDYPCPEEEICLMGICGICPDGTDECEGRCVNLTADAENCGDCGYACTEGETCRVGACAHE